MSRSLTERPISVRAVRRAAVLALGLLLVVAGPASAHPFFRGGEVPVDSLATLTLALAHGCASETDGEGHPTTDVALEVPDWLRIVDVPDPDGWIVELETADDGRVEVVNWMDDGGAEPAPEFDLDVVAQGEVGEERYVSVFQACDDIIHRWVGTPDEPADEPAIRLTLIAADPDSPAPPEEEPEPAEPETPETPEVEEPQVEEPPAPIAPAPDDDPVEDPLDDPLDEEEVAEDTDDVVIEDGEDVAAADDDGMGAWIWVIVAVIVVLLIAIAVFGARRRRNGPQQPTVDGQRPTGP